VSVRVEPNVAFVRLRPLTARQNRLEFLMDFITEREDNYLDN
jgi:hypothetical protein